ncbi:MAG: FtsX-like permease family protein [Spirochaetota bacterium]
MFLFVLRKMAANKWMVASLLIGVILAVAMVTTIPIYSRGILTRLLLRDLQIYQESTGGYPGTVEVEGYFTLDPESGDLLAFYDELSTVVNREVRRGIVVPLQSSARLLQQNFVRALDPAISEEEEGFISTSYGAVTGLIERLEPAVGRLPEAMDEADAQSDRPIVEAVITRETAARARLNYGRLYELYAARETEPLPYRVRVVGVVDMADPSDVYWSFPLRRYNDVLIMHEEDVRRIVLTDNPLRNIEGAWAYTYDYQRLSSESAAPLVAFVNEYTIAARRAGLTVRLPVDGILEEYMVRQRALTMTLWVLQVPLLLMLAFYLFMVAQVLIDHERNEIALMKSRGARVFQVFFTYVLLGLMLSLAGIIVGPFLGLLICQVLGASSGFLEFVQRRPLQLELSASTYLYGALASIVALLTILIPALQASRTTIVHHKQRLARGRAKPLWQVLFLDLILVAFAGYGLYRYYARAELIQLAALEATDLALDPVLLFVSTLFVVGLGLLFLRLYPLFVRMLYKAGARRWSPAFYASLIQVGRGSGKDQFLMLFLILSISIGVYNADAARTLNQNVEEQLRYNIGADIALQEKWGQIASTDMAQQSVPTDGPAGPPVVDPDSMRFVEPPFRRFEELPGVATATPVFYEADGFGREFGGDTFGPLSIYGVVPHEFGRVAWFRNDLLPAHWYNYLNLLAESPAAALLSRSLAEESGLELGDPIYIYWEDQPATLYYIYGFVDFWPGYNPYAARFGVGERHLAVVNLNYLQATTALEPYEVWLDLEPETDARALYAAIDDAGIEAVRFLDVEQELVRERNDPMLQGTNGTLSLGFLVSLGVCFVGFLLYWTFSIRERTLQFGLFRAMGMSRRGIVAMLGIEQVLISGAAVGAGFAIGRLASFLFVPLLQVVRNPEDTVPPLRVISLAVDQLRIAGFVSVMLLLGFAILSVFLFRIKIHQAVKLGEE